MSERSRAVFLERQSYRRRRLIDTIRVVPVVGLLMWFVPLLWRTGAAQTVTTADALIYIFAVWLFLIIVTAVLASKSKSTEIDE